MEEEKIIQINPNFDIEDYIFTNFEKYMLEHSKYIPNDKKRHIYNKAPKELAQFPTIVIKENNNIELSSTLDRSQFIDQIPFIIEIYTKDMVINGTRVASKVVMSELKYLVFDFFRQRDFERTGCNEAETSDYQIDRLIITVRCTQKSWNRSIN